MAKRTHIPERKCVACGERFPKRDLIRIARSPLGTVSVDLSGKSPGRGAYLCRSAVCWDRGIAKGGLERSLELPLSPKDREQLLNVLHETAASLSWVT